MRTSRTQIIDCLFPRTRKSVLTLLLMDSGKRWHLRDVARRTGCAVGTVRSELKGLTACGIVLECRDGNRMYYQANGQCPVIAELSAIIRKTSGLADILRLALIELGKGVELAFIFGSQARGEARPDSDVDLLVVGDVSFGDIVGSLADAQKIVGREINPTVYTRKEFRTKLAGGHGFVKSVFKDKKIFLIGDANELGKLAR